MPRVSIGPGEDVEAWCTRCRMNLNHRVIAVVGSAIQRVHCLTCGGDHKYYPPKRDKDVDSDRPYTRGKTPPADKSRKPVAKTGARAEGEWNTFMRDMEPGTLGRSYKISETYKPGEYVEHSMFGTGRVVEIVGAEKIEVIFKEGRKVLLFNRKT
jgi:hypothetical protein